MLIIDKSVPIEAREIAFIKAARKLETRMLDLRAADRTNTIRASYEAMQGAIEDLEELSANVSAGRLLRFKP
jgi:hypothetical protein